MANYTYLIVGGGMTAAAAVGGIREVDRKGSIGLIGEEADRPYNRPPLSKSLWKGEPLESVWREVPGEAVELHLGRRAVRLDVGRKQVTDDLGGVHGYGKLLLATGCRVRRFPFGEGTILYYRTLADYRRLRQETEAGKRFAVIGGGFIGSEIAAALAMNGKKVMLAFPGEHIGGRVYPPKLAAFLEDYYVEKGVEVIRGAKITGCERRAGQTVLAVQTGGRQQEIEVDGVVAGIGVEPCVELAQGAGLRVEDGIRVDGSLRTSDKDVYAAGDVASFWNPLLEKWMRVEHEDNANSMGAMAGAAMAGRGVLYDHLPFFYSDLFDLGYEAIGETDARLQMVEDWKTFGREGVVYYLREGRVRGVLLWGIFGQVDAARQLMAEKGPLGEGELRGRLPK